MLYNVTISLLKIRPKSSNVAMLLFAKKAKTMSRGNFVVFR